MKKRTTFKTAVIVTFCFLCCNAYSVPAYPHKVRVLVENGKEVGIFMRGDENHKYAVTSDGYTLLSDSLGWWYATCKEDRSVVSSGFKLTAEEDETEALKNFKADCPKGIVPGMAIDLEIFHAPRRSQRTASSSPITGQRQALVILMEYKDVRFKKSNDDFDALFNDFDYNVDGAMGSVRDFYKFASQGQFDYVTNVYGPYTAKYNMSYYGGNNSMGGNDAHAVDLCVEAMLSLPKDVDFSIYDNDGDGLIDNVHIIFAGYGEEAGASSNAIWSHEYPHRVSLKNEIGYSLAGYSCSPELRGNRGTNISNIGVVCHELGHALGAMDYYDTNYGTGGEYNGTGKWDIMASGSWNDDGRAPSNFNPYVRSEIFGWNKQEILSPNQQIVMPRMENNNPEQSVVYRMETGSNGDYFLLENRQQHSFDTALPGGGLMVYHVHPDIERYNRTNTVNASHPQALYPVCASYSEPSKKKYGNINTAECPFPGSKNVKSFTSTSSPAAIAWNGSSAKVSISYITMNSSDGSVSFTTGDEVIDEPDEPDVPTEKNLVFQENFEKGISGKLSVTSLWGKEKWRTYKKGNFISNADQIPAATNGASILMLFSWKDNTISESETTISDVQVEAGKNYILSFDTYIKSAPNAPTPLFTIYAEDVYGEYNLCSLNMVLDNWNTIDIPLTFADSITRFKLYGRIQSGGIFVDNLRLYKEDTISGIRTKKNVSENVDKVYNISGLRFDSFVGKQRRGFCIIRKSNGRIYKKIMK